MIRYQLLIALGLLVACADLFAADDEPIEEIAVLATRRSADVEELSAAVSVAAGDRLVEHKLATDALRSLPGVNVQQTTPGQGAAIIRGLKGSAILHLVDGMRLSNAMFRTAPTPWFALVPATSIERIEVVRGTPTSLYGSDAVGGIVQSVSRLPAFDTDTTSYSRDVALGFDTAELQKSIRATLDVGTRRLAASLSAEYLQTGDRRIGGGRRVAPSGYTSKAMRAVLRATPSDLRSWYFDLQYLEQPGTPRVDELVAGFGQGEPASSEFEFAPNRRIFAHLQHEYVSGSGIDWQIDAAWQRIDDDRRTRDFEAAERRFEQNRSDLVGMSLNASGSRGDATWIAGIDLYHDKVSSTRIEEDLPSGSISALTPRFPDGSTIDQAGLFVNVRTRLGRDHSIASGIRYSDVRIDLPDGTTLRPGRLSGDLGWVYDVSDPWQVVANIGFGFRAPNIADLGTLGSRPGNRFNVPNASLDAEKVVHADFGLRHRAQRWQFELMAFALRYSDRIVSVSTGGVTPGGRDIVQSVNAASSSLRGIEMGARVELSDRVEVDLLLNYARGTQRITGSEEPADRVPPLNGRAEVLFQHSDEWLFTGWLAAAARQDRLSERDVRDSRIDPEGTPGWGIVGVSGVWTPGDGWYVRLGIDNLLDKRYRAHGSGIDAPGRNVSLALRRNW